MLAGSNSLHFFFFLNHQTNLISLTTLLIWVKLITNTLLFGCVVETWEVEEEFARAGAARIIKTFLASRDPQPPRVPKEIGFGGSPNLRIAD